MANDFFYAQPVKIWFGEGCLDRLDEVFTTFKIERAVLVCGRHFAAAAAALQEKLPAVKAVFSAVEPDPQLSGAVQAAELARETDADTILGIGGGSALDTAKFAAAITPGNADPLAYYRGEVPFPANPLKIVCVPTTAGTGSEVTQVSVISNGNEKRTINNPVFMPKAAVVDPLLSFSVPAKTAVCTGLDALAHALEGYWSKNHQPISDLMAIEAVRLITQNLEKVWLAGPNADLPAHGAMAYAALLGGLSFAQPKTAACHACSYPICEAFHISHGEACAFTLDSFVRINADERLELLCRRAGLAGTEELAAWIADIKKKAGLRTRLSELGEADIPALAAAAAVHPLMQNNPVPMDAGALEKMFDALQ